MECILCNKLCTEKAETAFNITLSNHRKHIKNTNTILACKNLQNQEKNFNKHAMFIIKDNLTNRKHG